MCVHVHESQYNHPIRVDLIFSSWDHLNLSLQNVVVVKKWLVLLLQVGYFHAFVAVSGQKEGKKDWWIEMKEWRRKECVVRNKWSKIIKSRLWKVCFSLILFFFYVDIFRYLKKYCIYEVFKLQGAQFEISCLWCHLVVLYLNFNFITVF